MKTDFSARIAQALQSESKTDEDMLILQSYRAGYAAAAPDIDRAFKRGIERGVSETVSFYEKILTGTE